MRRYDMNKWFWFPIALGVTAILLVAVLVVFFAFPARTVLANTLAGRGITSGPPWWGAWQGGWGNGSGFNLPPALQGLTSIPSDQRFDHFVGAQVNLKDENGHPLTIKVIPGKVTAESTTSLTLAANDGSTQTFTLNDQTMIHSMRALTPAATGTPSASTLLQKDTQVMVVTLNNSTTATAVIAAGSSGFGWPGPGGWWGR
jgi:hypothetical protein